MKMVTPRGEEVVIRGILFDHDDLIGVTERESKLAWVAAIRAVGLLLKADTTTSDGGEINGEINIEKMLNVTPNDLLVFNGRNAAGRKEVCLQMFGSDFPFELIYKARSESFEALHEQLGVELRPGARELIEFVSGRIPCAVVTSSSSERVRTLLRNNGLLQHFKAVIGGEMVNQGKPDPEPYLMGADLIGVDAKHCLVLEDASTGVESGYRAGCTTIMVPNLVLPTPQDREFATGGVYGSLIEVLADLRKHNN